MHVGCIGLGHIGLPIANNILRGGFKLVVHDLDKSKAGSLLDGGATWAESPAALAAATDIIITSVPGPAETSAVIEGPRGVLEGIRPGAIWVEMSTTDLALLRRLSDRLAAKKATALDAPVTGGVPNARKGKAIIYVGGTRSDYEKVLPVLRTIGDKIFHMGPLGTGLITKLISNMLSFAHHVALGEGFVLGAKAGLDLWALREAIQAGYGGSYVLQEGAPLIFDGSYNPHFSLDLSIKDFDLAATVAREFGAVWRFIPQVREFYERAREVYGGDAGLASVVRLAEEASGVLLRSGPPGQEQDSAKSQQSIPNTP